MYDSTGLDYFPFAKATGERAQLLILRALRRLGVINPILNRADARQSIADNFSSIFESAGKSPV